MHVTTPSHASWVFEPGSPAAPVDEPAGSPCSSCPRTRARHGRARPLRSGRTRIRPSGSRSTSGAIGRPASTKARSRSRGRRGAGTCRVELEVFDFALPDENSMHAMLFYSERSAGALPRPQPRRRVPSVRASPPRRAGARVRRATLRQHRAAILGRGLHARAGVRGAGRRRRQPRSCRARSTGPARLRRSGERLGAERRMDDVSAGEAAAGDHVPLHAGRATAGAVSRTFVKLADNIHSNPGPGRALPIFVTSAYADAARRARSTSGAPARGAFRSIACARERARGRQYWFYNGGRPDGGAITIDAPATDAPGHDLGRFQARRGRVLLLVRRALAPQLAESRASATRTSGPTPSRSTTADSPSKPLDDQGYIHGDGVLMYPGEERLHPDEDRGIPGPIATVQLANFRRGLQDHQYLTMARQRGLHAAGRRGAHRDRAARVLRRGRPRQFSRDRRSVRGARLALARAIVTEAHGPHARARPRAPRRPPVMFDTPEADRILRGAAGVSAGQPVERGHLRSSSGIRTRRPSSPASAPTSRSATTST